MSDIVKCRSNLRIDCMMEAVGNRLNRKTCGAQMSETDSVRQAELTCVLRRCIAKWQDEGISLAPPVAGDEVCRVWQAFGTEASADVLQLFATVGGFQDYEFDDDFLWSLWPWEWLTKRNTESPGEGVMFCDHSIGVVTWSLRYETPIHSSIWSSHGVLTAPTLQLFLEQYLRNPWQLL
ncbi:MAG: hypothetical protein JNG89_01425 [Planctomycetaceae bacterium]|nr:hypothetical protein [Planctomycetaceae bacterium]